MGQMLDLQPGSATLVLLSSDGPPWFHIDTSIR